jgi:hypothetical protein
MIPLLVFYLHVVAFAAAFTRRWLDEGVVEGLLTVFFMGLIFFVGWSISSFVMRLLLSPEGWGELFDRDASALLLLTIVETVFYYYFLKGDVPEHPGSASGGNS